MSKNIFKYFFGFIIFFIFSFNSLNSYYLEESYNDSENSAKILQLKYITNEIKNKLSEKELNEISESQLDDFYLEYFVKYPIEEFVKGKEELINIANEKMRRYNDFDDLYFKKIIDEKYDKLNLEDKYFISNYIRHKMLSLYPYEKKDIIINSYIDDLSIEYYKKGIDLESLSNDEFSTILYKKMQEGGDISLMAISCDYASFPLRIYKINYSPASITRASSSRPIRNSSSDVVCDTEFSYYNSSFSYPNIKLYPTTSSAVSLINSYGGMLSGRGGYGNIHLIIGSKRYLYGFFSDSSIMDSIFITNG